MPRRRTHDDPYDAYGAFDAGGNEADDTEPEYYDVAADDARSPQHEDGHEPSPADEARPTSKQVAAYLAKGEVVELEMKQHWARVLPAIAGCVLGLVLVVIAGWNAPASWGMLTNAAWWIWLVLLAHLAWRVIEWRHETFFVTNHRLLLEHGLFVKKVAMMPLSKVTDMSYNRSVVARVLGYGTFVLESAGQDQALNVIDFVREPDARYRDICSLIFPPKDTSTPSGQDAPRWSSIPPQPAPRPRYDRGTDIWQEPDTWHAAPQGLNGPSWDDPRQGRSRKPQSTDAADITDPIGVTHRLLTGSRDVGDRERNPEYADNRTYRARSRPDIPTEPLSYTTRRERRDAERADAYQAGTGTELGEWTDEFPASPSKSTSHRRSDTATRPMATRADDDGERTVWETSPAADRHDDEAAWSVSREHATRPQYVRKSRSSDF